MADLRHKEFNPLKILHHFDRLRSLAGGRDIAPVTLELDPVAFCNHSCQWCVDPSHHPVTMSEALFENLISELSEFSVDGCGVEGIVFKGGGEPTLHPHFDLMVSRTVALGFAVGVVTNGSRLGRWAETLAVRASYVRVSIDGPTPESHERIHRSRDFESILEGVRTLVALRGERRHPVVGLTFAMDIRSAGLAHEAIRLGESLRVDYILMRPPFFEEVGRPPTMSPLEAETVRAQLRSAAAAYNGPLEVMVGNWIGDAERKLMASRALEASGRRDHHLSGDLPIEHRTGRCLASPVLAVVTADGTVYGCCNLRALPDWSFGRLDYEAGTGFRQIWAGKTRAACLAKMHRTACISHCTHPLSRYNEIIETLQTAGDSHAEFV